MSHAERSSWRLRPTRIVLGGGVAACHPFPKRFFRHHFRGSAVLRQLPSEKGEVGRQSERYEPVRHKKYPFLHVVTDGLVSPVVAALTMASSSNAERNQGH